MGVSPYEDHAVLLYCYLNITINIRIELGIEAAVCVQPRHEITGYPAYCGESSPYEDVPVRLYCDGIDIIIQVGIEAIIYGYRGYHGGVARKGDGGSMG